MVTMGAVREDERLLGHIYPVNKIQVDDEATAKTDEVGAVVAQLVSYHILQLSQLERDDAPAIIQRHHLRVVPCGRYIYQPISRDTEQFRSFGYDNYLGQF